MPIHINNSGFHDSPVVNGSNNTVIIKANEPILEWQILQDELIQTSAKLPQSSKEYDATKKALGCAMNKDKKKLEDVIRENISSFTSDIFKGIASGILVDIIMNLSK
ncbi:hypothetical protein AALC75_25900 [Lachnospiraceae bacterium 48-42]